MLVIFPIAIWFAFFAGWVWVLDRVNREFWYTGQVDFLLAVTFYTGGIFGVFLLLGRHNLSPVLARWVEEILEN